MLEVGKVYAFYFQVNEVSEEFNGQIVSWQFPLVDVIVQVDETPIERRVMNLASPTFISATLIEVDQTTIANDI